MEVRLPAEEFAAIFADGIEAPALSWTTAAEVPRALFLGGQPGCGKSTIAPSSAALFGSETFVHVDVDRLREMHPAYLPIVMDATTERLAPSAVQRDCSTWADMLRDIAMAGRRNMLVEGTMRSHGQVRESVLAMREAGYAVEARIMAVHAKSSEVSLLQRFEHEKQILGYGREIPLDYHDLAAAGIVETVRVIEEEKLFDRLVIFNRSGTAIYENTLVDCEWERLPDGARVMEAFRVASYDVTEQNSIVALWEDVVDMMKIRGAPDAEVAAVAVRRDAAKEVSLSNWLAGGAVDPQPFFDAVATMGIGQLDDWYQENVGYRPSEESIEPVLDVRILVAAMMYLHIGGMEDAYPSDAEAGARILQAVAKVEALRKNGLKGVIVGDGEYSGRVVDHRVAMGVVVQKVGRDPDTIAQHDVVKLSRLPAVGEVVEIKYGADGVGRVSEREVGKDRGR
jgi:hypothetical protein